MNRELSALRWSAVGALFMAALGFGFSYLTDSSAILLDGFFSLIGFAMGLLTIRVARLVRQTDDQHFQFGYAAFEPMLNAVKGLIILAVCVFAAISAIGAILDGGREINAGWGIVYAGFATAGCLAIVLFQRRIARITGSQLVEVDSRSWMVRIGREFWVLIHVLVPPDSGAREMSDLDAIRGRVADAVDGVEPGMVVDTVFTGREEWGFRPHPPTRPDS